MSTEKPQKRLMGKGRYYTVVGIKVSLSAVSVVFAIAAVAGVLFCAVTMAWSIFRPDYMFPLPEYIPLFCVIIFLFCCSLQVWLWQRQIKPVAAITRHNTGDLPDVETLVRASNLPPSHQQAELLRASGQGAETPAEQLLRAAQGEERDV